VALEINKSLTNLDCGDNIIGAEGGAAIGNSLEKNSTLMVINISILLKTL